MKYAYNDQVSIPAGKEMLPGELIIPEHAAGTVIFSHGSGSGRLSPRNRKVAAFLHQKNLGTLLFDLLTPEEDLSYSNRFDIELLTHRLIGATLWLEKQPATRSQAIGYFGASTGAASALRAAAELPQVKAVVSRGGRPDLAMDKLGKVQCPTLLIVGSLDVQVISLNREAFDQLHCEKKLEIIDGATHLFEEYGTMDQVCEKAGEWFCQYLQLANIER